MSITAKLICLMAVLVLLSFVVSNPALAQAPNCGTLPCLSILSNATENCGTYGIPPAIDLISHAPKAATVQVLVNVTGHAPFQRTDTIQIAANGKVFLGCSGDVNAGQHATYGIKAVTWH